MNFTFKVDRFTEADRFKWAQADQLAGSGRGETEQLAGSSRGEPEQLAGPRQTESEQPNGSDLSEPSESEQPNGSHLSEPSESEQPNGTHLSEPSELGQLNNSACVESEQMSDYRFSDSKQHVGFSTNGIEQQFRGGWSDSDQLADQSGPFDYELFASKVSTIREDSTSLRKKFY